MYKHNHKLTAIFVFDKCYGECEVVRWCSTCGAIVIDLDIDGRTDPGAIMKMQFPSKTKELRLYES